MAPRFYTDPFVKDAPMVRAVKTEPIAYDYRTSYEATRDGTFLLKEQRTTYEDGREIVEVVDRTNLGSIFLAPMRRRGVGP